MFHFLWQTIPPNLQIYSLNLSGFASIYEVFLGIGFGVYALAKIDDFLNEVIDVKSRTDTNLMETIDSNIVFSDNVKKKLEEVNLQTHIINLNDKKIELENIKNQIEEESFKILVSSRFYFLVLGISSLTFLIFCGFEEFLNDHCREFYNCLLFSEIFFLLAYTYLYKQPLQKKKGEIVLHKIGLGFTILIAFMLFGALSCITPIEKVNTLRQFVIILLTLFITMIPFVLVLLRHWKLKRKIEEKDYVLRIKNITDSLVSLENHAIGKGASTDNSNGEIKISDDEIREALIYFRQRVIDEEE